ncbi:hypothetical protein ACFSOV_24355 [Pedobacter petrophilus]|nr:hypothetical protein [Pedobacter petrophilus]
MKKQATTIQQKEKITTKDVINWIIDIIKVLIGLLAAYLIKR